MNHIDKNTGNVKKPKATQDEPKPSLDDQKAILEDQKAILDDKIETEKKKRKKTIRSGNSFIRPPKQNLLIMRHPVILRFD